MKADFLPKTLLGKWSAGLFILFIVLTIAGGIISATIGNNIEYPNPINSTLLGTVIYLRYAAAIIASVTGIIAIKKGENSVLVYISISLGILFFIGILIFLIANIIGPPNR